VATKKQTQAAKRNIKKAQAAAKEQADDRPSAQGDET